MAFYKLDPDSQNPTWSNVFVAPNFVHTPSFSLIAVDHSNYTYPMDGWYWFDTEQEAKTFFNLPEDPENV